MLMKPSETHIRYVAKASSKKELEYAIDLLERRGTMSRTHGGGDCENESAIEKAINDVTVSVISQLQGIVREERVKQINPLGSEASPKPSH